MKLKSWMVNKANRLENSGSLATAAERRASEPSADALAPSMRASANARALAASDAEALGPYRPLIGAIREELEKFVTTQLRLHLAIAECDRYVLSSIEVECDEADEHRELLRKFIAEFKPEQIKHYLAKEVIAGLRNASAIDLSQFGGLNATQQADAADEEQERYADLLAELRRGAPRSVARPYRVLLLGRWSQLDAPSPAGEQPMRRPHSAQTPLAAPALAIDIEDADGERRVELTSIVAGKRYAIGKGDGCDVVVNGAYASRRHCEMWFDKGGWWVVDAGSTNGIRVESVNGAVARSQQGPQGVPPSPPILLDPGAWLILSAQVRGDAREYPRLALRPAAAREKRASRSAASPPTPVTPIAPPRRHEGALTITARMASGGRSVDVLPGALPFRVGRSRNQALVVDWAHADVSGRHFEIVALDESGAQVVVHGDNGVTVDGTVHGPGTQFRWTPGQTLLLGNDAAQESSCVLTLSRAL
ncbi:MAG: FHA domain-containing protein [Betaproteobacteria bacterium]